MSPRETSDTPSNQHPRSSRGPRLGLGCTIAVFAAVSFPFLAFVVYTIASFDYSEDTESPAGESLTEYWDQSACFDLFNRMVAARRAGFSATEIMESLARADGAVKRYGPSRVANHCDRRYRSQWEATR